MPRPAKAAVTESGAVEAPKAVTPQNPKSKFLVALNELRKSEKTLWVKNKSGAIIILRNDLRAKERWQIELKPYDISILPKEALDEQPFQKLWMQGRVVVSDDENMEDELFLRLTGEIERKEASASESLGRVEESGPSKDLIEKQCLITGVPVFQTQREVDEGVPPLAEHVKDKAYLFPAEQRYDNGKPYWVFPKVSIGMNGTI